MSQAEVDLIDACLRPDMQILEWGSGGSTAYFRRRVKSLISIEHDAHWANRLAQRGVEVRLVSVPQVPRLAEDAYTQSYYKVFRNYVEAARNDVPFDAVLIDGRARLFCAIEALQVLLRPGGLIFIHDFFRRVRYSPFLLWRQPIAKIVSGQSLAVFNV